MEVEELAAAIHVVELSALTRSSAIRELVEAINWADENVRADDVLQATKNVR